MEVYVSISSIPSVLNLEVCNKPGGFTINLVILQLQLIYIPWGRTLVTNASENKALYKMWREKAAKKNILIMFAGKFEKLEFVRCLLELIFMTCC